MASSSSGDRLTRISVVDTDRCKPNKCGQECRKICPVNHSGKKCLTVVPREGASAASGAAAMVALIDEALCIGCGLCVRVTTFGSSVCNNSW
jgi:ATP-binding cassette subfamily E protein 1